MLIYIITAIRRLGRLFISCSLTHGSTTRKLDPFEKLPPFSSGVFHPQAKDGFCTQLLIITMRGQVVQVLSIADSTVSPYSNSL